ncbi:MAG: DUF924 domain-containing protein [Rhodospirillaceae bacterium]|nr:DUF924 domain-containing protein [Rhodospirillaceae bacterium]
MTDPRSVIDFWYAPGAHALWFEKDKAFDEEIRARFGTAVLAAQMGELDSWAATQMGALALLILLDQMARNIYRGQAKAFLGDGRALAIAKVAIDRDLDKGLPFDQRRFFYLPFEHAEDMANQDRSIDLFTRLYQETAGADKKDAEVQLDYAHRHRDIIRRFGRYPHRNEALGRPSTDDEIAFLKAPGSSF